MKGTGAVEELEVEGNGRLAVYFSIRGSLHCHLDSGLIGPGSSAGAVDYSGSTIIIWFKLR